MPVPFFCKKAASRGRQAAARKKPEPTPPILTGAEEDLVRHMEYGYALETDSLGSDVVLRNLKDDSVVRPASANRSTVEALERHGLISAGKSRDPLRIVWRMKK